MAMKILVVDDEPDVELLLTQRFRKRIKEKELEFKFACNGQQALDLINTENGIDLILTDINMPVMDGLTFLSEIGGLNSPIMSIIISAYGDLDNIRTAMNLGAFDFITKPINFSDLDVTLQKSFQTIQQMKIAQVEHELLVGLQQELGIAREIQQSMIPHLDHEHLMQRGINIGAEMIPAREVGGDFYDFFFINDEQVAMCIADVSGKGVPAALFMTMTKTLLKASAMSGMSPSNCLDYVNRFLTQDNDTCMFVSIFFTTFNLKTGELTFSNGGHNQPYIVNRSGAVTPLAQVGGTALGLSEAKYLEETVTLKPDDMVFLYTDGVTEAMNGTDELFGDSRLAQLLGSCSNCRPAELRDKVLEGINQFVGNAPQSDDLTMLAFGFSKNN